ncbi:hypothetical protein FB446DRAFT_795658 [Lentinula raphanica]|nr:hypothetical protein FB446DRAFT_795658 [Lentinula raphanica]
MSPNTNGNTVTVHYINGDKEMTRDNNGNFMCYCTYQPAGHGLTHVNSMRRHGKQVKYLIPALASVPVQPSPGSSLPAPIAPSLVPLPLNSVYTQLSPQELNEYIANPLVYGDQIKRLPDLEKFGLVYQTQVQGILCTIHHVVLKRTFVCLDDLNIPDELPTLELGRVYPHLQGHRVLDNHLSKMHHIHDSTRNLPPMKPVQRFNNHCSPFAISYSLDSNIPPSDSKSFILQTMKAYRSTLQNDKANFPENNRFYTPWLLGTKWPQIVKGFSTQKLSLLCAQPTASNAILTRACSVVHEMTAQAIDAIAMVPVLVLQYLNTPDPAKG